MRADLVELIAPVVEATGYEFWGLEFRPHGRGQSLLRVYIDHEDGIGIEGCEAVSRELSRVLDVEDPIRGEYVLEVSSPGLNRRLFFPEQYHYFCGEAVEIKTQTLLNGRKNFKGVLTEVFEDKVHVKDGEVVYTIPFKEILAANIVKI